MHRRQPFAQHHCAGAESDSNADFAEAPAHGVGKNAVDADGGEDQRKAGE